MVEKRDVVKPEPVTVAVVDDHGLFVRGLELLLGAATDDRLTIVASTSDPFEAEALVAAHRPDVLIVDLSMPTRPGEDVIAAVKEISPEIRTLVLSGTDDLDRIRAALRSSADGFVPKTSNPAELLGPILSVAAGWCVLPATVLRDLAGPDRPAVSLTDRELWVLRRLAAGAEVRDLANGLHVSERTTKRMLASVLSDLGVDSRIEAAALAGRQGLLEEPADPSSAPPA